MPSQEDQRGSQRLPDIRDFIFVRELAEVYLLLDHISGRWDKQFDAEGEALRADICRIGWPPNGGRVDAAEQAITLLRAKDRLNALARPASGATIAFTLLVVGEEDPRRHNRRWWWRLWPLDWIARLKRKLPGPAPAAAATAPEAKPASCAAGPAAAPAPAPDAHFPEFYGMAAPPPAPQAPGSPTPGPAMHGTVALSAAPSRPPPAAPAAPGPVAQGLARPSPAAHATARPSRGEQVPANHGGPPVPAPVPVPVPVPAGAPAEPPGAPGMAGAAAVPAPPAPMPPFTAPVNGELILPNCGFTRPPTRMSLARTAFPGLIGPAGHFNRGIWRIVLFLIFWMVLTCVLSWDITAGNVVLTHLDSLRTQQGELARKISAAEAADELARRNKAGAAGITDVPPVLFCEPIGERQGRKYRTVEELQLCTDKERLENERMVTQRNLHVWIRPWEKLYRLLTFETEQGPVATRMRSAPESSAQYGGDEEPARVLTHVIGGAVLPLCYGILGAGAATVRNLWAKLRESMLMPRDYTLALGQLALGATIGACIGLFVNPSGAATGADAALATSWTLSGSALSFIAGFGVEGVFLALEAFVRRVFGVPAQGEARRTQ